MEFVEYLEKKKIDPKKFKAGDPEVFAEYLEIFLQVHPESFTAQKFFMMNKLRRKYLLEETQTEEKPKAPVAAKPRVVPKPRPKPKT